jgi:hypothetical protein
MARLRTARMTDSTLVSSVDDEAGNLEKDLAELFGIPLDTPISGQIFGNLNAVAADGRLKDVIRFVMAGSSLDPEVNIGFEWDDSNEKYRLTMAGSELTVHHYNTSTLNWDLVNTLSDPYNLFTELDDVNITELDPIDGDPSIAGHLVVVDALGKYFELSPAPDGVVFKVYEALDVPTPPVLGDLGKALVVTNIDVGGGFTPGVGYEPLSGGGGGASYLDELGDVSVGTLEAEDSGAVLAVDWDPDVHMVTAQPTVVAAAKCSNVLVLDATVTGLYTQALVTSIPVPGAGQAGTGYTPGVFNVGSSEIVWPEAGLYLTKFSVEWQATMNGSTREHRIEPLPAQQVWGNAWEAYSQKFVMQYDSASQKWYPTAVNWSQTFYNLIYVLAAAQTSKIELRHGAVANLRCTVNVGIVKIR